MKNEKLSEVVKTVCLMARYGIQKRYPRAAQKQMT